MHRWSYRFLEKRSAALRVILLGAALVLLVLGWVVPALIRVPPGVPSEWEAFRQLAAIPATIWGLVEAGLGLAKRRHLPRQREIEAQIYEVLRQIEDLAIEHKHVLRLSQCGVKVWAARKRSLKDRLYKEYRRPLERIAVSPMYRAVSSSGLKWRIGMGVIGVALKDNDTFAIDVDEVWGPIRNCSEEEWSLLPAKVKFGLTYSEFRTLCRNGGKSAGPFALAVPFYKGEEPLGVVALDMPPYAARATRLGGGFDEGDLKVVKLMYALGESVFGDEGRSAE